MHTLQVRLRAPKTNYEIKVGAGLIRSAGDHLRAALGPGTRRAAVISNSRVFNLFGDSLVHTLRSSRFDTRVWLMKEGEANKSFGSYQQAITFLSRESFERTDVVVALGGGVVGDLAGFAAATYLRGLAFVQIPTTLLAQIDASVGGKVGINIPAGKNMVGAFHQPRLVLVDTDTLRTLPRRELTSGWCEAVKQGAVGDRKLFDRTVRLLQDIPDSGCEQIADSPGLATTIAAHCRFKAGIVAGDERESVGRSDARSRKILNFGHTTAHALETVTRFRRFRHGEAVGYGMLVAGEISKSLGMLPVDALQSLRRGVRACGPLPAADDIEIDHLIAAMKSDKKSASGSLKWVLLGSIGKARIVDAGEIAPRLLRNALRNGLHPLR